MSTSRPELAHLLDDAPCRQRVRHGHDHDVRARQSGALQQDRVLGAADQRRDAALAQAPHDPKVLVDHDVAQPAPVERLGDHLADPTVAADDGVTAPILEVDGRLRRRIDRARGRSRRCASGVATASSGGARTVLRAEPASIALNAVGSTAPTCWPDRGEQERELGRLCQRHAGQQRRCPGQAEQAHQPGRSPRP